MGDEVVVFVDELESTSGIPFCRICHDSEFESCTSLEAPCSCSGTVKFAHRDCIQRWCDEKGNTICEICLQNFEPGYTAPTRKAQLLDVAVTIRGSLEVPRRERELANPEMDAIPDDYSERWSSAANKSANFCRLVALIFTVLLLVRHLLAVLRGGTEDYPFALLTLLIAKTSGILLPMYILIRIIASFQKSIQDTIRHPLEDLEDEESSFETDDEEEEEDEYEEQHHLLRVEIRSS